MKFKTHMTALVVIFCVLGCDQKMTQVENHQIGSLVLKIQGERTKLVKASGIDSDIQYILLNEKDTLHIEYGHQGVIFRIGEDIPTILPISEKENIEKLSGHKVEESFIIWTNGRDQRFDSEYGTFLKSYYMYDTLNGILAKIVQPKKVGNGITGVYIPELKDGKSFSMYGINLDSTSQKEAMEIIKSIHYENVAK